MVHVLITPDPHGGLVILFGMAGRYRQIPHVDVEDHGWKTAIAQAVQQVQAKNLTASMAIPADMVTVEEVEGLGLKATIGKTKIVRPKLYVPGSPPSPNGNGQQ